MNQCARCGAVSPLDSTHCEQCGAGFDLLSMPAGSDASGQAISGMPASPSLPPAVAASGRSRTVYIVLGALVGLIGFPGIHNLYAGYTTRGLIQLICAWVSCGVLWIPMYIWTIVETCTVTHDGDGRPMPQ